MAASAVDCHAHWIPPGLAALLRRRRTAPRIGPALGGGECLVTFQEELPFDAAMGDLGARLVAMDGWGVARQVLSLGGLFGVDFFSGGRRAARPIAGGVVRAAVTAASLAVTLRG